MIDEVERIRLPVLSGGTVDHYGEALLTEEGLVLNPSMEMGAGLTWEELAKLLQHPFVKKKLEEEWPTRE